MPTKKVLICGATGFIGRNIAEQLCRRQDLEVHGTYLKSSPWDNSKVTMIKVDLTNKEDVNSAIRGKDIVIQAAAVTSGAKDIITKPYCHVTDNAVMNSLILRSVFENKISNFVFFSCAIMYQSSDAAVQEIDFDPRKEMCPNYFGAGWTKVYIEKMCEFYSKLGVTKYTVIRHSNIYGPYDKFDLEKSHVFGATLNKVIRAKSNSKITVWGTGEAERDLLYVSDLIDFTEMAINKQEEKFKLYNVGYGRCISVRELTKKIIQICGKKLSIRYDTSQPDIKTKLCLDISKAKKELGWAPKVSLKEGIEKTMEWYKSSMMRGGRSGNN